MFHVDAPLAPNKLTGANLRFALRSIFRVHLIPLVASDQRCPQIAQFGRSPSSPHDIPTSIGRSGRRFGGLLRCQERPVFRIAHLTFRKVWVCVYRVAERCPESLGHFRAAIVLAAHPPFSPRSFALVGRYGGQESRHGIGVGRCPRQQPEFQTATRSSREIPSQKGFGRVPGR